MPKQTCYTVVTPLPAGVSRQTVLEYLHSHLMMIDLNPLVESRHRIPKGPARATAEEFSYATWYSLTDKIAYLPGNLVTGRVSYNVCFHDLPDGLQTHCYAPLGLDIREKWTVGGQEPGELKRNLEMGIGAPKEGLFLREDVDMRCSSLVTGFVKKNLRRAHGVLVERLVEVAGRRERELYNERLMSVGGGSVPVSDGRSERSAEQRGGSNGQRTPTLVSDASVSSILSPSTPLGSHQVLDQSPARLTTTTSRASDFTPHRESTWTVSTIQHSPTTTTLPTYPFSPDEVTGARGEGPRVSWTPEQVGVARGHYRGISEASGGPPLGDVKGEVVVREWNGVGELGSGKEMEGIAELPG